MNRVRRFYVWMRAELRDWATLGGLIVLTIAVFMAKDQVSGLDARIAHALQQPSRPTNRKLDMDPLVTTVKNMSQTEITVTTHKLNDQEADAAQLARHLNRVKLARESSDPQ